MHLSNFVTYDEKEYLSLNNATSNPVSVENTRSKPEETPDFEMTEQKEFFSFDVPLELPEEMMMGVTRLEVYNTVYNITPINNTLEISLTEQELKEFGFDTGLVMNVESLYKIYDYEFVEKANTLMVDSFSGKMKPTGKIFDQLKNIWNFQPTTQ